MKKCYMPTADTPLIRVCKVSPAFLETSDRKYCKNGLSIKHTWQVRGQQLNKWGLWHGDRQWIFCGHMVKLIGLFILKWCWSVWYFKQVVRVKANVPESYWNSNTISSKYGIIYTYNHWFLNLRSIPRYVCSFSFDSINCLYIVSSQLTSASNFLSN
jgi:hypothetical protein